MCYLLLCNRIPPNCGPNPQYCIISHDSVDFLGIAGKFFWSMWYSPGHSYGCIQLGASCGLHPRWLHFCAWSCTEVAGASGTDWASLSLHRISHLVQLEFLYMVAGSQEGQSGHCMAPKRNTPSATFSRGK